MVFCKGNNHRFISGKTIPGNENIPERFDIKGDRSQLDGLLKLTIINTIFTSTKYNNRLMILIEIIVLSS